MSQERKRGQEKKPILMHNIWAQDISFSASQEDQGDEKSESARIVSQAVTGEYIYGILGLIIGLAAIMSGVALCVHGVVGSTSWTADLLSLKSELNDAAPGVVLFVVGLFIVIFTKPKVKLKNLNG